MRRTARFAIGALLGASGLLVSATDAQAAGMYFSDRGVRPMGRAGAYVAGADDLGALWYNPAGLADAGTSILVDFNYLHFTDSYTRQLQIVDASGTVRDVPSPTVNGTSLPIPIPTIAWSLALDKKRTWTLAGGLFDPQIALPSYPDTVNGQPSPARYSLSSYNGSVISMIGAWAAWKPFEQLRIGAGVMALVGYFQSDVTFSVCPEDRLLCAPEQSEWDAKSQIRVGPIVAPTVNGGITWVPSKFIRFGVSGQGPMVISSHATLQVQLPTDVVFDTAKVNGDGAHVNFELPAIFRMGVEVRPLKELRVEAAFVREFWTTQHAINAIPEGMSISGITGLPTVNIPNITFPRNFDNANSYRLGGEYTVDAGGYPLDIRAGVSYEQSAVPVDYVSILSLDMNKVTTSIGAGLHVGTHWRFDAVYAHEFCQSVYVPPSQAAIPRINPLNGNAPQEDINGGSYTAEADLIGLGLNYLF